jgi:hypothetical protein
MSAIKFVRSVRIHPFQKHEHCDLPADDVSLYQVWESFRANSGLEPRYV